MELQFSKTILNCLKTAAWEVKNEELVQEVRLPDGMEDMSRVLGTWGQILIRSKEWRPEGMSITGGVTAWVMYAGEESNKPFCVEVWMPYQLRWPFQEAKPDGQVCVTCSVRSMDARMVSSRKIMLRGVISVAGQGLEDAEVEVFTPANVPEDIQMLQKSYPITFAKEAGEKAFVLDEELHLPSECFDCEKLVKCHIQPEITDKRIMADKAVFRGNAVVSMLCSCEDGALHSCNFEIPISQYAELNREYESNAQMWLSPAITNVESELGDDGSVRLKIGMIGQYVIYDTEEVSVVEDMFSPERQVQPQLQILECEALLDMGSQVWKAEQTAECSEVDAKDIAFFHGQPAVYADTGEMEIGGCFQTLGTDGEANWQGSSVPWSIRNDMLFDCNAKMMACAQPVGKGQVGFEPEGETVKHDLMVDTRCIAKNRIPMVTGITAEEGENKDPQRPNLILRRAEDLSLWQMAKNYGSTVEKIREANGLTGEPNPEQMLLIPVV